MKKKIVSVIIISIIVMFQCSCALATTSAEYRKQIEEAKAQSQEAQSKLDNVEGEINTVMQEVEDLNVSIDKTQSELTALSNQIEDLDKSIQVKTTDLKGKQKMLEERLVASYMNGNNTYLDALFSGGFTNFITNYESIKQIAEYDNNLITEVKNSKQELENQKSEYEKAKKEKEDKSSELKKLKADKEKKVSNLTDEQKQIQAQMDEYDKQMKIISQKEAAAAEKEAAAARVTQSSSSGSSSSNSGKVYSSEGQSGRFLWPVPSSHNISSNYGYRIHPISGVRKLHAGIDIAAAGGADIVAGDDGTVLLASFGYNGGYGNYIIINHGNGITTRYAHCSNLFVSTGDTVKKGQVIAAVGTTGASTGNHCHFEVRINGETTNPLNYL